MNIIQAADQRVDPTIISNMQAQQQSAQLAAHGTPSLMARYAAENDRNLLKWKQKLEKNQAMTTGLANLSVGLMAAYGYGQGNNAKGTGTTGSRTIPVTKDYGGASRGGSWNLPATYAYAY